MPSDNRRYMDTHEWVEISGPVAIVGISDHAQDALGDITYVEMPAAGSLVRKGKECGVIESVKATNDVYSPISGTVTETNTALDTEPELVNKAPYTQGWLFKVENFTASEIADLKDGVAYARFLESGG